MKLHEIAHSRAGDKGVMINISLIAFDPKDYPHLEKHVTPTRVKMHFGEIFQGEIIRYALPSLGAMNFVMKRLNGDDVTSSLRLDAHGKCLSSALLDMEIPDSLQ